MTRAGAAARAGRAAQRESRAIVLAWLLRHPTGIQPVLGTVQPARLSACAQALDVQLARVAWHELFAAARGDSMP